MGDTRAYLVIQTGSGEKYISLVGGNTWTIGRAEGNYIILDEGCVSRNHGMIQRLDTGEYYFIDFGSRNGSFLRGRRVSIPMLLRDGDELVIGETQMVFRLQGTSPVSVESGVAESATEVLYIRRLVSILVADICEFSVLARQVDETLLFQAMSFWFQQVGQIIQGADSLVHKYIGDAVMAVWVHGSESALRQEILALLRRIPAINQITSNLDKQYGLPWPLRIGVGVNTGYAMVGNSMCVGERPEHTVVLGDAVNMAFRLESATRSLGIDIALGKNTFDALANQEQIWHYFHACKTDLKGYEEPVLLWGTTFTDLSLFLGGN